MSEITRVQQQSVPQKATQKQQRYDTAANWSLYDPVLLVAEIGIVTDSPTGAYKIGDGKTSWSSLPTFYACKDKHGGVADDHLDGKSTNTVQNKVVKSQFDVIQQQIQSLMAKHVSFSASVNHSLLFVNESKAVIISASISGGKGEISITRSGQAPWKSTGEVASFTHQDTVKGVYGSSAQYTVETNVFGIPFTRTCTVEGVYPIYVGAAKTKEQAGVEKFKVGTPQKYVPANNTIQVTNGDKIYFLIPPGVKAPTSFVLDDTLIMTMYQRETLSLNGTTYKVFESDPVNKNATLKITVK